MQASTRVVSVFLTLCALGAASAAQAPADLRGRAVTAAGAPAPDTVVWIEAPAAAASTAHPTGRIVLDQRNLAFIPHVLAVRVGTVVDFPNNDRVFHNVFSFRDGKKFDLGMYPVGALRHVTFDRAGLSRIFCNIHPNMAAYVIAIDSPYFARADDTGAFAIPEIPSGAYRYHAWRPGATAELTGTWSPASGPLTVIWK
jgi:plastocyanin